MIKHGYILIALLLLAANGECSFEKHTYGWATTDPSLPIARTQIFGERCSGTTFFSELLSRNFTITDEDHYGHKHFPCWFAYPYDEEYYVRPLSHYTLEGSDDCLFLVIVRNPYDWLRSLHQKPYHTVPEIWRLNFSQFIRSPWLIVQTDKWRYSIEQNPSNRRPFINPMVLRTARLKNMLLLQNLVRNAYFINYETLVAYPEEVLSEIHDLFGLTPTEAFTPVLNYMWGSQETKRIFTGSHYDGIAKEDVLYINQFLNEKLENSIGYTLKKEVE